MENGETYQPQGFPSLSSGLTGSHDLNGRLHRFERGQALGVPYLRQRRMAVRRRQFRRKNPGGRGRQVCPRSRLDDPCYPVVLVEDNAGLTHGQ